MPKTTTKPTKAAQPKRVRMPQPPAEKIINLRGYDWRVDFQKQQLIRADNPKVWIAAKDLTPEDREEANVQINYGRRTDADRAADAQRRQKEAAEDAKAAARQAEAERDQRRTMRLRSFAADILLNRIGHQAQRQALTGKQLLALVFENVGFEECRRLAKARHWKRRVLHPKTDHQRAEYEMATDTVRREAAALDDAGSYALAIQLLSVGYGFGCGALETGAKCYGIEPKAALAWAATYTDAKQLPKGARKKIVLDPKAIDRYAAEYLQQSGLAA